MVPGWSPRLLNFPQIVSVDQHSLLEMGGRRAAAQAIDLAAPSRGLAISDVVNHPVAA